MNDEIAPRYARCHVHNERFPHGESCPSCVTLSNLQSVTSPPKTLRGLPETATERKTVPLYSGLIRYFPDALIEVARTSFMGNEQHNPGTPLHWDRSKSQDELDALTRHLWEAGTMDADGIRHSAKVAWRALANLQKELEAERGESTK